MIEKYLKDSNYSVRELQLMATAFEGVCKSLCVKVRDDKIAQSTSERELKQNVVRQRLNEPTTIGQTLTRIQCNDAQPNICL